MPSTSRIVRAPLSFSLLLAAIVALPAQAGSSENLPSSAAGGLAPVPSRTCPSFDLTDPGQSMEHVPHLDQGDVGDCYSYSGAGAIDAWRFSTDPPGDPTFTTSPDALAITAKDNLAPVFKTFQAARERALPGAPLDGFSSTLESLNSIKRSGICNYKALGGNFSGSMYDSHAQTFWNQFELVYFHYHSQFIKALKGPDRRSEERLQKQEAILQQASASLNQTLCDAGLNQRQGSRLDIASIESLLESDTIYDALRLLEDRACAGNTIPLPADFPRPVALDIKQFEHDDRLHSFGSRQKVMSKVVDAMFNFKKKQPLMIDYCSAVMREPSSKGLAEFDGSPGPTCGGHASLIIGRGPMTDGRCGFLIRNSWGTAVDSALGFPANMKDNGDVWVAEDDLFRNVFRVAVLPPQGESYVPPKNAYAGTAPPAPYSNPAIYPTNPYTPIAPIGPPVAPTGFIAPTDDARPDARSP